MEIKLITNSKKIFLDLLLLGDEQESMIDKYLDDGDLFVLYDDDLKGVCVVTNVDDDTCELKNIAVYEQFQGLGYGKKMIHFVWDYYKNRYKTMIVGTGEPVVPYYEKVGFIRSHIIVNFFVDNYDHVIIENGIQLVDMIYLRNDL